MNDLVIMSKCMTGNGRISRRKRDVVITHLMGCYGGNGNHLLMKVRCSRCQPRSILSHEGFHPHFRQSPSVASMVQNSCENCERWPPFHIYWNIGTLTDHTSPDKLHQYRFDTVEMLAFAFFAGDPPRFPIMHGRVASNLGGSIDPLATPLCACCTSRSGYLR